MHHTLQVKNRFHVFLSVCEEEPIGEAASSA